MYLFTGNIEEIILTTLINVPKLSAEELISLVRKKRGSVTKQGVYRVFRKLKTEQKIVIYKSELAINPLWIEQLKQFVEQKSHLSIVGDISKLQCGEKISLLIRGLIASDELWTNIFSSLEIKTDHKHALFLYNPHNWFIFLGPETEKLHVSSIQKRRPTFLAIGGKTPLDKLSIRLTKDISVTSSISETFKSFDYFCVLDDFIFSVRFSKKTNLAIDLFFKKSENPDQLQRELLSFNKKVSAKLLIEKNPEKSLLLKKKFLKDFHIPKEYRDF